MMELSVLGLIIVLLYRANLSHAFIENGWMRAFRYTFDQRLSQANCCKNGFCLSPQWKRCRRASHTEREVIDLWASTNPYEVLGVGEQATMEEIRSAYYTQSKRFHPDRAHASKSEEASAESFQKVSAAYSLLIDPESRRLYDRIQERQRGLRNRFYDIPINPAMDRNPDNEFARASEIFHSRRPPSARSYQYHENPTPSSSPFRSSSTRLTTNLPTTQNIWNGTDSWNFARCIRWFVCLLVGITTVYCTPDIWGEN
ncbi:hypothetical protein T265_02567 [Opisthorchis viverrini]|uniref:J domain-containing protein n=1 Tax=Opisthorchis viverrini TaxID=6198 RepID=A0A075A677_OPIVI|nr:hypothetical protein T265_02567 [Opisthorchis viverrini]KER31115.1 hypothetical protein T265_02567 [Opisthorchis viverrini]